MTAGPAAPAARVAWDAAFHHRDFRLFLAARFVSVVGIQMQSVAIAWQVYSITGRPMSLAWVGLAQFFPVASLSLLAGQAADRFRRRKILMLCQAAMAALSAALFVVARAGTTHVAPIYAVLVGIGVARAFLGPANQSILPSLVPVSDFGNAVAWGSSSWQVATVLGPTLGGILYATLGGAAGVYSVASCCGLGALALITAMSGRPAAASASARARSSIFDGVRYVRGNPIVLGAISLDLFAVLLGGATALLPVYARDILHLGPWALGALRSAPAAGAAVTAIVLALRPIEGRAGAKMFAGVAAFGAATIVFGLSRSFLVSLVALVVLGAADMVSVFVRSALVQLATPDPMRGRVSAVNMVFIGASNELGEFESGVTAAWLGTIPSVVVGGLGTLLVVAIWMLRFPQLRRIDRLNDAQP
ncbi:MAG TPA: MFS transporter [Polyangiaceae bacterium]|nr:MFS transporter [Polyangiaceae bacterium]